MSDGVVLQQDSIYYILLCVHPSMESPNHVEHSVTIILLPCWLLSTLTKTL